MLTITDSSVILGPCEGQQRSLTALISANNDSETHYTASRLTLRLRDAQGNLMLEMALSGGPISPGRQVLTFTVTVPGTVISAADGVLSGMSGRWVTPVAGIQPFQAPTDDAQASVTAAPQPAERALPPWERFAVKRTATPQPAEAERTQPPWERFAASRTATPRAVVPAEAPEGPWAMLDAGEVQEAMALFDRHRLDEVGQRRLRALLQSDDPQEIAWGCQISRLVRWVTVSTMRGLLTHRDSRVRREAVDSLGRIAGASAQADVAPLLNDSDAGVAAAAALCMARITGKAPRW